MPMPMSPSGPDPAAGGLVSDGSPAGRAPLPGAPSGRVAGHAPVVSSAGGVSSVPGAGWTWRGGPVSPGTAVVFDIDGVISEAAGRQHFLKGPVRNWDRFFDSCDEDPVIEETAKLLELLDGSLTVVLLTGRPSRVLGQTRRWLERNGLRWDLLIMRVDGDRGAVASYKRSALSALRSYGFEVCLAFEDDPGNREMFREEGVHCIYIHSGYYA